MKLIDKDAVVAEIERRINNIIRTPEEEAELKQNFPDQYGVILGYRAALSILDDVKASKVSSKVSEDLDIAIGEYCSNPDNFISYIDVAFAYRSEQKDDIPLIIKAIKFGANWQKQQMLKAMDLGEPPYLISVEQAYYNVKKMLEDKL